MQHNSGFYEDIVSQDVTDMHQKELINSEHSIQGIAIGLTIIGLWAGSLIFLLSLDISKLQIFWIIPASATQTFLYTGLFITAHDAMHCSLFPQNLKINHFIGAVAVYLYALFSYQKLLKNHWLHHRHPTREVAPDFQSGNLLFWDFKFLSRYFSYIQIAGLSRIFNWLQHFSIFAEQNMFLFWVITSLLSSVQLFYFGTFLPHRKREDIQILTVARVIPSQRSGRLLPAIILAITRNTMSILRFPGGNCQSSVSGG
ncbi:fatty acid desaturase [Microseira wollei NIES-4236]|uniref:Fatty acid desaturase n=1 Tax=Microseira wollei NIES-4236 TaxID=2530354 RepID=A0AAV3WNF4_9CYAN|nr:beta-carotene ketolase [Microseira wollei]GET43329.1 fatty acid desaturase [Microseira wollei NIES-4236]